LDDASAIEIVQERDAQVYGFTIKTASNSFLHRVTPLRDPSQPRFWCVVVFRCTAGGLPDKDEPAWICRRQLRREDIADTMRGIRSDPTAWLAEEGNAELREWILAPAPTLNPSQASGPAAASSPRVLATAGRKETSGDRQIEVG
jgi:hypothetical protein